MMRKQIRISPSFSASIQIKLTQDQKRELTTPRSLQIFQNPKQWDFSRHKFGQKQAKLIKLLSDEAKQIRIQQFRVSSNNRPNIIKQISPLKFTFTKMVDVASNKITSIEALTYLYMPFLQRLNLYNNLITCIQSLRKCKYMNIIYISLLSNPNIAELKSFSEVYMKQMHWLWIQHKEKITVADQNVRWMAKLNCSQQKWANVSIRSSLRIEEDIVLDCIKRRYPLLQIDVFIPLQ